MNTSDAPTSAAPAAAQLPAIVLDTNVVLDWLLFANPRVARITAAVADGRVRWVVCPRMRDELSHTLARPLLAKWQPCGERLLAAFDRHSVMQPAPATLPSLRCTDADDQVFLDLAVACGARWLLSHDRALLRLARRAARHGLAIGAPDAWPGLD